VSSYRYNVLGQRISKTAGTTVTHYTYGLNGQLLSETTGAVTTDYLYFNGQPLALVRQGGMYYIHTDHLGTPRAVTNTYQNVVWRWDSDPFGMSTANEDPDGDGVEFTLNLRFPGQYYDIETGLHYNYFRYYDPSTGRYITSDPIGLQGGLNTYGYVGGNPINAMDPLGLAVVYIWRPGTYTDQNGKVHKSAYGHTSILTNDGNYTSHHPDKTGLNPLESLFRTYDQDKALYGRDSDFIAYIKLPNEDAASQFASNYRKNEDYWGPFGNCADAASSTLQSGGLGMWDLNSGLFDYISYPTELEKEIRGIYWTDKYIIRDSKLFR
jgi:RHS repeat-associated protein